MIILLKWHWDSCSRWVLFQVSNITKFDEGSSFCTTTFFTTPSGFLINPSASLRLIVDGCAKILLSFPISHVGVNFMPSPRPHWASFTDIFLIELKLLGSFFFRRNRPWNIALQLLANAVMSFLFNFWEYNNWINLGSLQGFSLSSRICRLLILKMESLSIIGLNIGAFSFSLIWAWSVDCTPSASSFLR